MSPFFVSAVRCVSIDGSISNDMDLYVTNLLRLDDADDGAVLDVGCVVVAETYHLSLYMCSLLQQKGTCYFRSTYNFIQIN